MKNYNSLEQVPDFPETLNLELTNHCNLKCKMCINHKPGFREKGFMDKD